MRHWIAISLGDVTGIGPEVTLKAIAVEAGVDDTGYLLIGDEGHTRRLNQRLGLGLQLESFDAKESGGPVVLLQPGRESLPGELSAGAPEAAGAAVAWLEEGARWCLGA